MNRNNIPVWDPFIRFFHWALVLSFILVWATGDDFLWLHAKAGYFILAMIMLRVLWGVIGTQYARFNQFIYRPGMALQYVRDLITGRPQHYIGHNPAGGWMVILILFSLAFTSMTGIWMDGVEESVWEDLHETMAILSLLLVFIHVGGVVISSFAHRENLVMAMLTGNKQGRINHD